jgi:hypothetical protein
MSHLSDELIKFIASKTGHDEELIAEKIGCYMEYIIEFEYRRDPPKEEEVDPTIKIRKNISNWTKKLEENKFKNETDKAKHVEKLEKERQKLDKLEPPKTPTKQAKPEEPEVPKAPKKAPKKKTEPEVVKTPEPVATPKKTEPEVAKTPEPAPKKVVKKKAEPEVAKTPEPAPKKVVKNITKPPKSFDEEVRKDNQDLDDDGLKTLLKKIIDHANSATPEEYSANGGLEHYQQDYMNILDQEDVEEGIEFEGNKYIVGTKTLQVRSTQSDGTDGPLIGFIGHGKFKTMKLTA